MPNLNNISWSNSGKTPAQLQAEIDRSNRAAAIAGAPASITDAVRGRIGAGGQQPADVSNYDLGLFLHPDFQIGRGEQGQVTGEIVPGSGANPNAAGAAGANLPPQLQQLLAQLTGRRPTSVPSAGGDFPGYTASPTVSGSGAAARNQAGVGRGQSVVGVPGSDLRGDVAQAGTTQAAIDFATEQQALTAAQEAISARLPRPQSSGTSSSVFRPPQNPANVPGEPVATATAGAANLENLLQQQLEAQLAQQLATSVPNAEALALYESLVSGGGTPQSQQASADRQTATSDLLSSLGTLGGLISNPLDSAILQGQRREFLENVLPQITQASEAGGSSANALQQLLVNDAETRLAEQQAQTALEAQLSAAQAQAGLGGVLQGLTASNPVSEELLGLLGMAPNFQQIADIRDFIDVGGSSSSGSSVGRRRSTGSSRNTATLTS